MDNKIENYQKLLLHYNANLFSRCASRRKDIKKLGKNSVISIGPFTEKVISYIVDLPEDLVIYMPERKGFRLLAKELEGNGIRVITKKIIPGTFTNPATSYFMEEKHILFLNDLYHARLIKEQIKAGGMAYSLALLGRGNREDLYYNHRSVKSLLVFFYLFLILRKDYKLSFREYASKIKKEEILFAKLVKDKLPSFITASIESKKLNEN